MNAGTEPREFVTHSAEETIALGSRLAPLLRDATVVLLTGELGTGKTTLTKGIAEGFSAAEQENVTSPTFTLVHEYRGPQRTLYHIDLYRLESQRELETLGLEDLMREDGALLLIEWGEKFESLVRDCDLAILIERAGEDERRFTLRACRGNTTAP